MSVADAVVAVPGLSVAQRPVDGHVPFVERVDTLRLPGREMPVAFVAGVSHLSELTAERDRLTDRLLDEVGPLRAFHCPSGDIERGDDAVLRRRGGVHHERLLERRRI